MKINFDKRLLKICTYVVLTAGCIFLLGKLMDNAIPIWEFISGILGRFFSLLNPLIVAFCIAYLLWIPIQPMEQKLLRLRMLKKMKDDKRKKLCRIVSIIAVLIALLVLIAMFLIGIYVMVGGKISRTISFDEISRTIAQYFEHNTIDKDFIKEQLQLLNLPLSDQLLEQFSEQLMDIVNGLIGFLFTGFGNIFTSVIDFATNLFSLFVSLVISIYLLLDKEYFQVLWRKCYFLVFREHKSGRYLNTIGMTFHTTFRRFIRGQLVEAFFVGVLASIALSLLEVDYPIMIGAIAGITNMIPYIGPFIGTVLAAIMALLSGDLWLVLWVIIAMQVVQQIDNNFLEPRIVGNSVGLHPVFIMLAILIGGNLGGLFGMLVAVPFTASVKNLFSEWYKRHGYDEQRRLYEEQSELNDRASTEEASIMKKKGKRNKAEKS